MSLVIGKEHRKGELYEDVFYEFSGELDSCAVIVRAHFKPTADRQAEQIVLSIPMTEIYRSNFNDPDGCRINRCIADITRLKGDMSVDRDVYLENFSITIVNDGVNVLITYGDEEFFNEIKMSVEEFSGQTSASASVYKKAKDLRRQIQNEAYSMTSAMDDFANKKLSDSRKRQFIKTSIVKENHEIYLYFSLFANRMISSEKGLISQAKVKLSAEDADGKKQLLKMTNLEFPEASNKRPSFQKMLKEIIEELNSVPYFFWSDQFYNEAVNQYTEALKKQAKKSK